MTLHRQVPAELPTGQRIEVDEGMEALLLALWQQGYQTTGSCEHQPDTPLAWIAFTSEYQAIKFWDLIDGAVMIRPNAEDAVAADPKDPALHGAVGVGFPADSLPAVTVQFGGGGG